MSGPSMSVVIGRFQTDVLTDNHKRLLHHAADRGTRMLVLLGSSNAPMTKRNPLTWQQRQTMIENVFALDVQRKLTFMPLPDCPTNDQWVQQLDMLLGCYSGYSITLYSGPCGFQSVYKAAGGKYPVDVVTIGMDDKHASLRREALVHMPINSSDARRGVIHAVQKQFTAVYPVVDVAVFNHDTGQVLLGQKPTDGRYWRLIGGFVDPSDISLEQAASREVREETGIEPGNLVYEGSFIIPDWRYRGCEEKIMSALFSASYIFGAPKANDDITDVRWFSVGNATAAIHPNHAPLLERALKQR